MQRLIVSVTSLFLLVHASSAIPSLCLFVAKEQSVSAHEKSVESAELARIFAPGQEFSVDSRKTKGKVFVALSGAKSDGHLHIQSALDNGALRVVADANHPAVKQFSADPRVILVTDIDPDSDYHPALWELAKIRRQGVNEKVQVLAVGGSNGKTTVTSMLAEMLGPKTHSTRNSSNGWRGLPEQIASFDPNRHNALLFEVGTDTPGELGEGGKLALANPSISVMTSIGPEHMERFGSIRAVLDEELEMCRAAINRPGGGSCIMPHWDYAFNDIDYEARTNAGLEGWDLDELKSIYEDFYEKNKKNIVLVHPDLSYHFALNSPEYEKVWTISQHWPEHLRMNVSLAIRAALEAGETPSNVVTRLLSQTRGEINNRGAFPRRLDGDKGVFVLDATYNANEGSMRANISYALEQASKSRKKGVFVLGQMADLGADSQLQHQSVLKHLMTKARKSGEAIEVVLIGEEMHKAENTLRSNQPELFAGESSEPPALVLRRYKDSQEAAAGVSQFPHENALLYFQGSRGTQVEKTLQAYERAHRIETLPRHLNEDQSQPFNPKRALSELKAIKKRLDDLDLPPGSWIHLTRGGGSAMGNLAVLLQNMGYKVTVSDLVLGGPMKVVLEENKIPTRIGANEEFLNGQTWSEVDGLADKARPDLVVMGNAASTGHPEFQGVLRSEETKSPIPYVSMPEALYRFYLRKEPDPNASENSGIASLLSPLRFWENSRDQRRSLVVTGTHGKTTTSSMASWAFAQAQSEGSPGMFIGGKPKWGDSGSEYGDGRSDVVFEGDEYNTAAFRRQYSKFLFYDPDWLVINGVELDHKDIFRNVQDIVDQFRLMLHMMKDAGNVKNKGVIAIHPKDSPEPEIMEGLIKEAKELGLQVKTFGRHPEADFRIVGDSRGDSHLVDVGEGQEELRRVLRFTVENNGERVELRSPMLGEHNVMNATAVAAAMQMSGKSERLGDNQSWLDTFPGVERRLDVLEENERTAVISDFAHHPTAMKLAIEGSRQGYPDDRLSVIVEFESATASSAEHQQSYVEALAGADVLYLKRVNREMSGASLTKDQLDTDKLAEDIRAHWERMGSQGRQVIVADDVNDAIDGVRTDGALSGDKAVVLVMSNGQFRNRSSEGSDSRPGFEQLSEWAVSRR